MTKEMRVEAKDRTGSKGQDLIVRRDPNRAEIGLSLGHGTYWVHPNALKQALLYVHSMNLETVPVANPSAVSA